MMPYVNVSNGDKDLVDCVCCMLGYWHHWILHRVMWHGSFCQDLVSAEAVHCKCHRTVFLLCTNQPYRQVCI